MEGQAKEQGPVIAVIIVTHNSEPYFAKCLAALKEQTYLPHTIIVVDSGSTCQNYLRVHEANPLLSLHLLKENVGFCQGNNRGMVHVPAGTDYVLFLNPDAFLTPSFLEKAIRYLESPDALSIGALTGLLLGYDIKTHQPTGHIDSAGIFCNWYGRWYDRAQGQIEQEANFKKVEHVPAICGALMLCRKKALDDVQLAPQVVMNPSFYMYKEDIDLSIRMRRKGWSLVLVPTLQAYHCRGWKKERAQVPRPLRLLSARNEMRLHAYSPYWIYSALKYSAVKLFDF